MCSFSEVYTSYSATLRSAEAALQRAQANREKAKLLQDRYGPLRAPGSTGPGDTYG